MSKVYAKFLLPKCTNYPNQSHYAISIIRKHKTRTSHAPCTNGLVDGMNRSLQEYLRCIINGNDTRHTEWSTDVKLFPLSYNSQITTTLGMSPHEMVFNQKPQKNNHVYSKRS